MARQRDHIVARPAVSPGQLDGYAKRIAAMVDTLEGEGGCSICGIGPHVPRCPIPAMREAVELLEFMGNIPTAAVHVRGHSEGAA